MKKDGIKVLHEDRNIIVCIKPPGVLSQRDEKGQLNMEDFLDSVHCVHRLDREVSGVMAYAKTQKAAANLSAQIQNGSFEKEYLAIVHGTPNELSGIMEDLLFKDSRKNKTYVVKRERKGVKMAKLSYDLISSVEQFSLVKIKLYTGRTHQIRVQFSSRKLPIYADKKYGGSGEGHIALYSYQICLKDVKTNELKVFHHVPQPDYPWSLFRDNQKIKLY